MAFRAEIYNSRGKMLESLPPELHMAYRFEGDAERAAERKMTELSKTKKYAGCYLRYRTYFVSASGPDLL